MNILFRVDSSSKIGLGHLMRCLVLAKQYDKDSIVFAAQELGGNANNKIVCEGYRLITLNSNSVDDLIQIIDVLDTDMIVFDHYSIDYSFEKIVKTKTGVKILSFDDVYDRHYCDILLNHNIYADAEKYRDLTPDFCEIRCGSEYTLIRDEFKEIEINKRPINKVKPVVFVSLGGADTSNISLIILEVIVGLRTMAIINIATTKSNKNIGDLQEFAKQHKNINICVDCNIAKLMNESDYAIITPSVICYEAMYLGLPFLAIQTADNQHYVSKYLSSHNFLLGNAKELGLIKPLVRELLKL